MTKSFQLKLCCNPLGIFYVVYLFYVTRGKGEELTACCQQFGMWETGHDRVNKPGDIMSRCEVSPRELV